LHSTPRLPRLRTARTAAAHVETATGYPQYGYATRAARLRFTLRAHGLPLHVHTPVHCHVYGLLRGLVGLHTHTTRLLVTALVPHFYWLLRTRLRFTVPVTHGSQRWLLRCHAVAQHYTVHTRLHTHTRHTVRFGCYRSPHAVTFAGYTRGCHTHAVAVWVLIRHGWYTHVTVHRIHTPARLPVPRFAIGTRVCMRTVRTRSTAVTGCYARYTPHTRLRTRLGYAVGYAARSVGCTHAHTTVWLRTHFWFTARFWFIYTTVAGYAFTARWLPPVLYVVPFPVTPYHHLRGYVPHTPHRGSTFTVTPLPTHGIYHTALTVTGHTLVTPHAVYRVHAVPAVFPHYHLAVTRLRVYHHTRWLRWFTPAIHVAGWLPLPRLHTVRCGYTFAVAPVHRLHGCRLRTLHGCGSVYGLVYTFDGYARAHHATLRLPLQVTVTRLPFALRLRCGSLFGLRLPYILHALHTPVVRTRFGYGLVVYVLHWLFTHRGYGSSRLPRLLGYLVTDILHTRTRHAALRILRFARFALRLRSDTRFWFAVTFTARFVYHTRFAFYTFAVAHCVGLVTHGYTVRFYTGCHLCGWLVGYTRFTRIWLPLTTRCFRLRTLYAYRTTAVGLLRTHLAVATAPRFDLRYLAQHTTTVTAVVTRYTFWFCTLHTARTHTVYTPQLVFTPAHGCTRWRYHAFTRLPHTFTVRLLLRLVGIRTVTRTVRYRLVTHTFTVYTARLRLVGCGYARFGLPLHAFATFTRCYGYYAHTAHGCLPVTLCLPPTFTRTHPTPRLHCGYTFTVVTRSGWLLRFTRLRTHYNATALGSVHTPLPHGTARCAVRFVPFTVLVTPVTVYHAALHGSHVATLYTGYAVLPRFTAVTCVGYHLPFIRYAHHHVCTRGLRLLPFAAAHTVYRCLLRVCLHGWLWLRLHLLPTFTVGLLVTFTHGCRWLHRLRGYTLVRGYAWLLHGYGLPVYLFTHTTGCFTGSALRLPHTCLRYYLYRLHLLRVALVTRTHYAVLVTHAHVHHAVATHRYGAFTHAHGYAVYAHTHRSRFVTPVCTHCLHYAAVAVPFAFATVPVTTYGTAALPAVHTAGCWVTRLLTGGWRFCCLPTHAVQFTLWFVVPFTLTTATLVHTLRLLPVGLRVVPVVAFGYAVRAHLVGFAAVGCAFYAHTTLVGTTLRLPRVTRLLRWLRLPTVMYLHRLRVLARFWVPALPSPRHWPLSVAHTYLRVWLLVRLHCYAPGSVHAYVPTRRPPHTRALHLATLHTLPCRTNTRHTP